MSDTEISFAIGGGLFLLWIFIGGITIWAVSDIFKDDDDD